MAYIASQSLSQYQPNPASAASDCTVLLEFTASMDVGTDDVVELGVIPAYNKVVRAELLSEGITETATLTVGIMSGVAYSQDDDRTSNAALFSAVADDTAHEASIKSLAAIAKSPGKVGIGLTFSAAITGAATKKVWLRITYAST